MREIDFAQYHTEGRTTAEAWEVFDDEWNNKIGDCARVRVSEILSLKQGKDNWTIIYRLNEGKITQSINPALALEILNKNLIGKFIPSAWFIINPTRIEEMVRVVLG